jgi:hypothetical protein
LLPNNGKTKFVEMRVSTPEVTDSEAKIDFGTPNKFIKLSDDFKKWYNDLKAKLYGDDGYPWTRLSHTYDWGKTDNHIGMSEFAILPGSEVEIDSVTSTTVYRDK